MHLALEQDVYKTHNLIVSVSVPPIPAL